MNGPYLKNEKKKEELSITGSTVFDICFIKTYTNQFLALCHLPWEDFKF